MLQSIFALVLITMLLVTSWAQSQCPLWAIPANVGGHPWFIATLFDTYFGFLTFYCWVFYKENSALTRISWFIAIMLGGNLAMATYMLIQLSKLRRDDAGQQLLLKK